MSETPLVRSGLDQIRDGGWQQIRQQRIGVCCNRSAVDEKGIHLADLLAAEGIEVTRWFEPEHGLDTTAQDMEPIDSPSPAVVSLYGNDEDSLHPRRQHLEDLDLLLFDIQDIGTRYYTFAATLRYILEVAASTDTRVIVLDRPNPLGGEVIEGGTVRSGFDSFVGASPISIRHAMTMGEIATLLVGPLGLEADLQVIGCQGWQRSMRFEECGLPWIAPSPNMPTVDTAMIYPGMCLIEGTDLSEGRGTEHPFHWIGAPWFDATELVTAIEKRCSEMDLHGVSFSPVSFTPRFQKFSGRRCHGIDIEIAAGGTIESLLLGVIVLEQARRFDVERFRWRSECYEFVSDRPAIDLLWGGSDLREGLEEGLSPREIIAGRESERQQFIELRQQALLY